MSTTGRPLALSEEKKAKFISLLEAGCSKLTAANAVNCHPQTVANTAKRDPLFAERLAAAQHAAELLHIANINKAADDVRYWRASAWMLERLRPETFARRAPDSMSLPQLAAFMEQFTTILVQEVPVARFRKNIIKHLDRLLKQACFSDGPFPHCHNCPFTAIGRSNDAPNSQSASLAPDQPTC
jgi:hypothetical protein